VSELRRLVGLSPHISEEGEPFWDARLVNRLVHLNLGVAVAERCAIDVVEYEAGLSRIASEKWYSQFGFNRTFPSSDAFDRVLRSAGVPDLGVLEATIGLEPLIAIAESNEGQAFRDWFWEEAATLVGSGARVDRIVTEFGKALGRPDVPLQLPISLKLRFIEKVRGDYIVGATGAGRALGYSARSERGAAALARQLAFQSKARLQAVAAACGSVDTYGPCPCGSGGGFRFCCGPKRGA
jgi:hypothetical protein